MSKKQYPSINSKILIVDIKIIKNISKNIIKNTTNKNTVNLYNNYIHNYKKYKNYI